MKIFLLIISQLIQEEQLDILLSGPCIGKKGFFFFIIIFFLYSVFYRPTVASVVQKAFSLINFMTF